MLYRTAKAAAKFCLHAIRPPLLPQLAKQHWRGKALEIGPGPQPFCKGPNVVYLDKFTSNKDGMRQPDIVADASAIPVPDESFDFLYSSHCLEHCQNVLKTLYEWKRVLRPEGVLFLVLPHARRTIDRFREITPLEHLIDDYQRLGNAVDRSHDAESQAGWERLPADELAIDKFEREWGFAAWDWDKRHANGVVHFHVWTQNEIADAVRYVGLEILHVSEVVPERVDSFVVVSRKP